jgi:hypothetical protein
VRRLALVLVLALLAAGSAGAKEGVEATLLTAVPASAKAGTHLRIEWRLAELNSGRPFGAGGVFIRLVGGRGSVTGAEAREVRPGLYAARVRVPSGGIHRIRIGLHAWTSGPGGTGSAAEFFRIANDPSTGTWAPLRRPLRVPTLGANRSCPVSPRASGIDFARYGVGAGVGPGPAYPVGWADGTIAIVWARNDVDATLWGVQKVLWFVSPGYQGPVLVRGVGLDNPYRVRFERGRIPRAELRLPAGTHDRPSFVRIRKPGCYAFQIDGLTFSRSIVFRAVR